MIAVGRLAMWTGPFAAVTVTGNVPSPAWRAWPAGPAWLDPGGGGLAVLLHAAAARPAAQATAISRRAGTRVITHPPVCRGGRSASVATPRGDSERAALPPRTGRRHWPGVRARPPREASPLRDSAGFTPASLCSASSRGIATRHAKRTAPRTAENPGARTPRRSLLHKIAGSPVSCHEA